MKVSLLTILISSVISIANAAQIVQLWAGGSTTPRDIILSPSPSSSGVLLRTQIRGNPPASDDENIGQTYFNYRSPVASDKPVVQVRFPDGTVGYGRLTKQQGRRRALSKLTNEPPGPMATEEQLTEFFRPGPVQRGNLWDTSIRYPIADWMAYNGPRPR